MDQGLLQFTDLLAEERKLQVVNVASVPKRSPFRYPGGKTWLVPQFRAWIRTLPWKPNLLVEPFAGGGIISLTAAFEQLAEKVVMVELDREIAAVWKTILTGDRDWLINRIVNFQLTRETAIEVLEKTPESTEEIAFRTVVKNRTFHGGILAEGSGFLKEGENGKGISSRWYPQTIAQRIRSIGFVANRIEFIEGDAFEVLSAYKNAAKTAFFIDPPYTVGGKKAGNRLYNHWQLDHDRLFKACSVVKGEFLMTYDNADEVVALAEKYQFNTKPIAMKNTHHAEMTELLIGRTLNQALN